MRFESFVHDRALAPLSCGRNGLGGLSPPVTIEGAVTQDGGGNYVDTSVAQLLWTGLPYFGSAGTAATCRDWTSALSTDTGTGGCVAAGWFDVGKCGSFACDNAWPDIFLQCAEQ
jgi:hypothetical protein